MITLKTILPLSISASVLLSLVSCNDESSIPVIENSNNDQTLTQVNELIKKMNNGEHTNSEDNLPPISVISINDVSVFSESYDPEGQSITLYWVINQTIISQESSFEIELQDYSNKQDVLLYVYDGQELGYSKKNVTFSTSDSQSDDSETQDNYPYSY